MLFHQEYLDEVSGIPGQVGMWWLKVKSAEEMPRVIGRPSTRPSRTRPPKCARKPSGHFSSGFISMWGNIKLLVTLISQCGGVHAAARDRQHDEHGHPRTVPRTGHPEGHRVPAARVVRLHPRGKFRAGDARARWLASGARGRSLPTATFNADQRPVPHFEVTPKIIGIGVLVAATLGIVASIMPSLAVARMSVVEGLKSLD